MKKDTYKTDSRAVCCPEKGYRGERVFAAVWAGNLVRYVFADGRTLTKGPGVRFATFPDAAPLPEILEKAKAELRAVRPVTRNLYVTVNPEVTPAV